MEEAGRTERGLILQGRFLASLPHGCAPVEEQLPAWSEGKFRIAQIISIQGKRSDGGPSDGVGGRKDADGAIFAFLVAVAFPEAAEKTDFEIK